LEVWTILDGEDTLTYRYRARRLAYHFESDFAVVEIYADASGASIASGSLSLPYVPLAETDLKRGETVYVFGFPYFDDNLSFYQGDINNIDLLPAPADDISAEYRTNAAFPQGVSGGLASNASGRLVGVPIAAITRGSDTYRVIRHMEYVRAFAPVELQQFLDPLAEPNPLERVLLNYSLEPQYGVIEHSAIAPSSRLTVQAGGSASGDYIAGCNGYTDAAPDLRLLWHGGDLVVSFEADYFGSDATLLVNEPSLTWICNDDAEGAQDVRDPLVTIPNAQPGQYDIFVGSYEPDMIIEGTLTVGVPGNEGTP